ncbi:hypothetical protein HK102_003911 [Quaeritorhiza haematococci]|nr:hypothetical protein HK102_003911 [Quaeritorhiza haematococci]
MEYNPTRREQRILCATCGTPIPPNPANMCVNCIRNEVDITEGIPKQATLHFCKGCERYLQPPNIWVSAQLESRELLALCLRKLKGLSKVRLVDAGFVWTEPHSRRVKVKLAIQKEVFASTILQQVFITEFMVAYQQCEECTRVAAQLTWKAAVQVRQKGVAHKRTFYWLEQVILKHNAHRNTTNIKEAKDGIDFYYSTRGHAIKMVEFLQSVVPVRVKASEQLISADIHSGTANYKYTYSVEIVPICKDDLVCLPLKLAKSLSNISPLVLCHRVSNYVSLIDPNTLKVADLRTPVFFENPFTSLCEAKELVEFYIIDVQYENIRHGKFGLATVEVARANDLSVTYITRTHLGHILRAGDHAMGYLLKNTNFNNPQWEDLVNSRFGGGGSTTTSSSRNRRGGRNRAGGDLDDANDGAGAGNIADVILVRKSFPNARKKNRGRNWRLKNLAKEKEEEELAALAGKTSGKAASKTDKGKNELDYELFLRDIEEDSELRGMINLYKDPTAQKKKPQPSSMMMDSEDEVEDHAIEAEDGEEEEPEEDFPTISVDELLDDLEAMTITDPEGDVVM